MISFPKEYRVLSTNRFEFANFTLVPIRYEDRLLIMEWRNEQLYHLRQSKPLNENDQENYFNAVLRNVFSEQAPQQLLFSYLENNVCVGYGGLVHINWIDKNAEISFIMNTKLERDYFSVHWASFLQILEKVAFAELNLHKIYTYAYDLRPHLFSTLESSGYKKEAILKEHCLIGNEFKNVVIHSKFK
ncbi:GNAT family N-acetyltransferase [Sphingobacterium hungaricum]